MKVTKVKFISFETQKRVTNSINPDAVFEITSQDGEWLKLNDRFTVHFSMLRPVK